MVLAPKGFTVEYGHYMDRTWYSDFAEFCDWNGSAAVLPKYCQEMCLFMNPCLLWCFLVSASTQLDMAQSYLRGSQLVDCLD